MAPNVVTTTADGDVPAVPEVPPPSDSTASSTSSNLSGVDTYRGIEKQPCPTITFEEAFQEIYSNPKADEEIIIIDTRTPKEYEEAHVYGAINIPLMSNDERHLLGLTYHQNSKEAAIDVGWELFEPKIHAYVKQYQQYRGQKKKIFIYCWRGGMRSRIVTNLLLMNNYPACQVMGGYKRYLNDIVWTGLKKEFPKSYRPTFIVLLGHTGTRKTEILRKLQDQGYPVLDLEGLAGHRSSLYGSVNLQPKTQKMFSIGVYYYLRKYEKEPYIFVEGEAHKVGDVHLPMFLNERILNDVNVLVEAKMPTRVTCIRDDYLSNGANSVKELHDCTNTIRKYIGKKNADELHKMLEDPTRHDECIEWLMVNHYDKNYRFAKKEYEYDVIVASDDLDECCSKLVSFYKDLKAKHERGEVFVRKAANGTPSDSRSSRGINGDERQIEKQQKERQRKKKNTNASSSKAFSPSSSILSQPIVAVATIAILGMLCFQVFKKR